MERRRLNPRDSSSWSEMEKERLAFWEGRAEALRERVEGRGADTMPRSNILVLCFVGEMIETKKNAGG